MTASTESGGRETCDLPLTHGQRALWFIDQLQPGNVAYNISVGFRLAGPLDPTVVNRCVNAIVNRHEALRTTFGMVDGRPVQRISKKLTIPLAIRDLAHLSSSTRSAEASRLATRFARQPFDLSAGPLFRAHLTKLGAQEHELLISVHHIVFDGWSMGIWLHEFQLLYGAYVSSDDVELVNVPPLMSELVAHQQDWMESPQLGEQLEYWKARIGGSSLVVELPTDFARPPTFTYSGAQEPFHLESDLCASLQACARQEGCTFFMIVLAMLYVLIARYSRQSDVCIGSPFAIRDKPELENAIGYLVNMLVLQADVSDDPPFREHLRRVRKTTLGAYSHHEAPFERLVAELRADRDQSRNPIFQVMLQMGPDFAMQLPGIAVSPLRLDPGTAQFDLSFQLYQSERGVRGHIEYATDLFEASTVQRMAGHLKRLLTEVVANPDLRLSELPLLSTAEYEQLVVAWNDTATEFPREECVHQLVEVQAEQRPDAAAVICGSEKMTYYEFNQQANRLAHHLRALGVGSDSLVGISLERSINMLVAVIATLKAGGAYVPMDPTFPEDRLRLMLEDSGTRLVITQESLLNSYQDTGVETVVLDQNEGVLLRGPVDNPTSLVRPEHLAYVIYTSGSTGRPKGVLVPHRAVVNFVTSLSRTPGMTARDRIAAVTTLSFDIHVLELLLPLTVGASIVIITSGDASDGEALGNILADSEATVMQATPATWRLLAEADWRGPQGFKILCGGEVLPSALASDLLSRADEVWNMYGPTETTVWSTCGRVQSNERVSIGRPIANTRVYVLDPNMQPTPIGVAGELYIGGEGVTRGYLGRGELTAERFVEDPFSKNTASRLYRTGDLVTYLRDGRLDYIHRLDDQVKLRGFRIELGEIEAHLVRHPEVSQAAVVIHEENAGDRRLIGYVAAPTASKLTAYQLRTFLLDALPIYMVPSAFVVLEELPLTPNRKVDKKALPQPTSARPELGSACLAPRDENEKMIARIWEDLLGVENISMDDNFFDVGGHSLLIMQMRKRLCESFNREVPVIELFRHSTMSELAKFFSLPAHRGTDLQTTKGRAIKQKEILKKLRSGSRSQVVRRPSEQDLNQTRAVQR